MVSGVPVIDLSRGLDQGAALEALDNACRNWGFFQITGHGVDSQTLGETLAESRAFFAQSPDTKRAVMRSGTNPWGFYDREITKNTRDWKQIYDVGPEEEAGPLRGARPQWPKSPPGFRATLNTFSEACESLSHRLLAAISSTLGMPAKHLGDAFRPTHTSFLRLNYYPECDDPAPPDADDVPISGHLGINRHTDAGALTVLLQDEQAGLQVQRGGVWTTIEPRSDALVINIGDIVQVWSNDTYPAPLHRVIAHTNAPRFSVAYFFNPAYTTDYAPLPSMCGADDPPRYGPINWGRFRAGRAGDDYTDSGEEIQISQFRR